MLNYYKAFKLTAENKSDIVNEGKKPMIRLFAAVIAFTLLLSVCSCGAGAQDESELIEALSSLAPKARELYEVIYGDSLEIVAEAGNDGYYAVSENAEYKTISELKAAIRKVFSSGYSEVLYNTAFNGATLNETVIYAKFIEKDGRLYMNPKSTEDFGEAREFDLSGARVVKANRYRAIIAIPDGVGELEVTIQKENGEWRIDSALF